MGRLEDVSPIKVVEMMEERIGPARFDEILNKYYEQVYTPVGEAKHAKIVSQAITLARKVIAGGGTPQEIDAALGYYLCCRDAIRRKVDWKRYANDNDISGLEEKYGKVK